jgi:hypothetical protein
MPTFARPSPQDTVDALYLWDLWRDRPTRPARAFVDQASEWLDAGRMDLILEALLDARPQTNTLAMTEAIGALAQRVDLPSGEAALLIGLSMGGTDSALAPRSAAFWADLEAYLKQALAPLADVPHGALHLHLVPSAAQFTPAAFGDLELDGLRGLTRQVTATAAQGPLGQVRLQHGRLCPDSSRFTAAGVQVVAQRVALAAVIYDPAQWSKEPDALPHALATLDPLSPAWQAFQAKDVWILPPVGFRDAMGSALHQLLRLSVDLARLDRGYGPGLDGVTWEVSEAEAASGILILQPTYGAVALDPIEVPLGWFALMGPVTSEEVLALCYAPEPPEPAPSAPLPPRSSPRPH